MQFVEKILSGELYRPTALVKIDEGCTLTTLRCTQMELQCRWLAVAIIARGLIEKVSF